MGRSAESGQHGGGHILSTWEQEAAFSVICDSQWFSNFRDENYWGEC